MASSVKDIEQPESLEIKLGTYWFVRIGVLLLLTGLGSLAWFNKDFFLELSKETKVTLFYILSFGMGGKVHLAIAVDVLDEGVLLA